MLLSHHVMPTRVVIAIVALCLVAVSLAAFGSALVPDRPIAKEGASTTKAPRSLAAARVFMLLPDGKVEITDAWARRVFRWDGHRWVEVERTQLETPQVESR